MKRKMILIGGGDLREKETLAIDSYIAAQAKERAGDRRACGLFIPTASHDHMPYYNSFHKIYTGLFDIKTDVALTLNVKYPIEKMRGKFEKADFLYVGGGDTVFMLDSWKQTGLQDLILDAYQRGVIICGLSAGAICWFETMYSDSVVEDEYALYPGLGWLKGCVSPHYNQRVKDFDEILLSERRTAWGIENNAALLFENEETVGSVCAGGNVYMLDGADGMEVKKIPYNKG